MLAGALELFLVSLGLTYYVATIGAGLRVLSRARKAAAGPGPGGRRGRRARGRAATRLGATAAGRLGQLRAQLETTEDPPARAGVLVGPADCVVYYLVPCMNEAVVIEDTVASLLGDARALVVVVDDGSDDRTGELAAAVDRERVLVVRRELPQARLGKGPALNAGFAALRQHASARGIDAARITVCVMDADGRLSPDALDAVLPLFADPRVGGVQLPVRIRNRGSLLTLMQDLEFWGVCAVAQLGRISSGTVSLGGNGQFTRLSALLELGGAPWRARLTEDLDLALALASRGWRLTSTSGAFVSQQGVTSLRALINQRTRWYQGHMQAVRWLRQLWTSRQLSHLALLELTIYLLVPWALVLPWSIIFNYNLLIMISWILGWVAAPGMGSDLTQRIATVLVWYAVSCVPIWLAGFLYARQESRTGYIRAFFIAHLLLIGNYVTYAACWRAVYRLITGANSWEKTQRTSERSRPGARPAPVPALVPGSPVLPSLVPASPALAHPALAHPVLPSPVLASPVLASPVPATSALASPAPARLALARLALVPAPRTPDVSGDPAQADTVLGEIPVLAGAPAGAGVGAMTSTAVTAQPGTGRAAHPSQRSAVGSHRAVRGRSRTRPAR